jgi:hypothetical protein
MEKNKTLNLPSNEPVKIFFLYIQSISIKPIQLCWIAHACEHDATTTKVSKCYIVFFSWMRVNGPTIDIVTMQTT